MRKSKNQLKLPNGRGDQAAFLGRPGPEADLTWLLHRAAQRMRGGIGEEAERHGIQLREYIVLSALGMAANLTQLELGKALGLDKTTLMLQLDRLETKHLVVRRTDPRDRRARIPQATPAGRALQFKVAEASKRVEAKVLRGFSEGEQRVLRTMLCDLIGDREDTIMDKGSCL
jgi:DNA-binding MarR family transcriptional regulator